MLKMCVRDRSVWIISLDNKENNFGMTRTLPSADKMSNLGEGGLAKRCEQDLNGHYS